MVERSRGDFQLSVKDKGSEELDGLKFDFSLSGVIGSTR